MCSGQKCVILKSNKRINKAPSVFTRVILLSLLNIIIKAGNRDELRRERDGDKEHDVNKHNAERFSRSCVSAFGVLIKSREIFEYI